MTPTTTDRSRWYALAVLAAAQFMVVLDATIVNVALPAIRTHLHFGVASLQWVVDGYTLTFGGLLLLGGRAADAGGRRRMFLGGLALFTGASLVGGLAASPSELIAARAIQGAGAALLSPAALSIVTRLFADGRERNVALGLWGALAGLGGTLGVVAGGILVDWVGWRWVFFVNVPVGALAALLALRLVPAHRDRQTARSFDLAGAATGTAALVTLVFAVIRTDVNGWGSTATIGMLALAAALASAFLVIESRSAAPLLPLRLFSSRSLSAANVALLLNGAGFVAMFFLTTLSMQEVLGLSALRTGLAFVPMGIAAIAASVAAGPLVTRFGPRPVFVAGAALGVAGLWLLADIHAGGSYAADILPGILLVGLGLPLVGTPNTISAVADARPADAGIASGLASAAFQVGGALGLAVIATLATHHSDHLLLAGTPHLAALADGFSLGFRVAAGVGLANLALALTASPGRRIALADPVPVA